MFVFLFLLFVFLHIAFYQPWNPHSNYGSHLIGALDLNAVFLAIAQFQALLNISKAEAMTTVPFLSLPRERSVL